MDQRKRTFDDTTQKSRSDTKRLRIVDQDNAMPNVTNNRRSIQLVSSDEEEEENGRSRIAAIRAGKRNVSRELNAILDDSDDEIGSFLKGSPSSPKTMASKRVAVSSSENAELKDNIRQSIEARQLTVGMKTLLDQRIQDSRPDPAVIAALEEKVRKLYDANRQLEAEMDRKSQQHSFEIRVKEAVNEAKLKRLEDKLDHATTQIETEKQQVTELKKRLKAAMRQDGIINESLQQLKWKSEGATDGLSQFESGLRHKDNRSQESTALIPSRDVDPAELRRRNEVFLLKQQFSALQGEKQLVVRQRDAFSTQLKASITTNETLRADIYRNGTAHGIEIERLQKHFKTLQAEKERLEHRIAEFIATFETFKATKKVDRETIAAHIQTIENFQKVDRSLLIGEYRKLEEKRCRDNESFQIFCSQSEIALAPNVPKSPFNASSPNQASINSLASLASVENSPKVEAIPQSHAVTLHQSNIHRPPAAASRSSSTYSSPYNAFNVPIHQTNNQRSTAASISTYSSLYNALNVPIHQSNIQRPHEAVPGPAGNLPIRQDNPHNPFNASGSRGNDPNPLKARPVAVLNVPVRQSDIQNHPSAASGAAHTMAVVIRPYSFLISGSPAQGPRTMDVSAELLAMMDSQIAEWERHRPGKWMNGSAAGGKRCIESRWSRQSLTVRPLPADPHHSIACPHCISTGSLCTIVGVGFSPIVVPLPPAYRASHLTPRDVGYYVNYYMA
jgi:hypothetical protein